MVGRGTDRRDFASRWAKSARLTPCGRQRLEKGRATPVIAGQPLSQSKKEWSPGSLRNGSISVQAEVQRFVLAFVADEPRHSRKQIAQRMGGTSRYVKKRKPPPDLPQEVSLIRMEGRVQDTNPREGLGVHGSDVVGCGVKLSFAQETAQPACCPAPSSSTRGLRRYGRRAGRCAHMTERTASNSPGRAHKRLGLTCLRYGGPTNEEGATAVCSSKSLAIWAAQATSGPGAASTRSQLPVLCRKVSDSRSAER